MRYRRLGITGLEVSELSYGTWVTFGTQLDQTHCTRMVQHAFSRGVNFFDCAEVYAEGEAEKLLGVALRELPRSDYVVSTKIYWGGTGPNKEGLNRKRLVEGTQASLQRLGLTHVDLLYCHRPDPHTAVSEVVRSMSLLVQRGCMHWWGTSEWSAAQVREAFECAERLHLVPPSMEQPQYNLLTRQRVEQELSPLCTNPGLGLTTWSPLAYGVLTGKYAKGFPTGSRLEKEVWLRKRCIPEVQQCVKQLGALAAQAGMTTAQAAIAWCLRRSEVSTVILGATSTAQLDENLAAAELGAHCDGAFWTRVDDIFAGLSLEAEAG
ncbi:MAG: aldo/keto reductase [Planctomycetes bacterium]|nr:aldo/keto reductase [Planctomycetota bacterium]